MTRRLGRVYCDDINGGGCGGILGMKVVMIILTSLGVEKGYVELLPGPT